MNVWFDLQAAQVPVMGQIKDAADFANVLPVKKKSGPMVEKRKELLGEFITIIGSG